MPVHQVGRFIPSNLNNNLINLFYFIMTYSGAFTSVEFLELVEAKDIKDVCRRCQKQLIASIA